MKIKCKFGIVTVFSAGLALAALGGCIHTQNEIQGGDKPIKLDINATLTVNVRIQKEVDSAFDSVYGPTTQAAPATQPAAS